MIKRRIAQLLQLSATDWKHLLTALMALPLVALSLQLQGFNKTRTLMAWFAKPKAQVDLPEELEMSEIRQVARMVSVAANHGFLRANCLQRSMLTWCLLERKGLSACLRIGACRNQQELRAHAWVEFSGEVINDRQNIGDQFTPFDAALVPSRLHII